MKTDVHAFALVPRAHRSSTLVALILVGSASMGGCQASSSLAAISQPNVIVMVADDLGWADVGFHGSVIDTPALDRLAAEGVQLNHFYTTPICTPTRAALMTGRDPIRLGTAYGVIQPWHNNGVSPSEHFMPESFEAAGYQTAMVGKWHLGHAQQTYHPNERGFEHFYGHLHTEVGYYPPFARAGGSDFQENGTTIDDEGYETYLLADEVSRYIEERDKAKPFFIYMPFLAPHTPFDAPDELKEKYKDYPERGEPSRGVGDRFEGAADSIGYESVRALYAAVVDALDQGISRVLDALDEQGVANNTIVLFLSDNGGFTPYYWGGASNQPLRGGKAETYEGGIRVVSLMRWPSRLDGGQMMDQTMTVMDVFPTLADATGIEPQNTRKLDGRSMWPAIADGTEMPARDDYIYFLSEIPNYGEVSVTAFDEQWKLVQFHKETQTTHQVTNELYDRINDPNEYENLADEHPQRVEEMAEAIRRWRSLHPIEGVRASIAGPPGWRAPKDWASYPQPLDTLQAEEDFG
ncbi:MAG: arylsulfatase B, partial [Polyangiales bacterium]